MASIGPYNELLEDIQDSYAQNAERTKLRYVTSVPGVAQEGDEVEWVRRNIDMGMAPVVSSDQNSPIIGQGTYSSESVTAVESRFVKAFNRTELANLTSPDSRYRIKAEDHIKYEIQDQLRRAEHLQEMVANDFLVRGAVNYVETAANMQVQVAVTVPGFHQTVLAGNQKFSDTANSLARDIIDGELKKYWQRNNERPAAMRMSLDTWDLLKSNTQVVDFVKNFGLAFSGGSGIINDSGMGGLINRDMVIKAFDWPDIIIDDASTTVGGLAESGTATTGFGAGKTLVLDRQVYGIRSGDSVLVDFDISSGNYTESNVTTVVSVGTDGRTITVDNTTAAIPVGALCAVKARFLPVTDIQLVPENEASNLEWRYPYYSIEANGDTPVLPDRFGLTVDAFSGGEQGLNVFRRVWNKFGIRTMDTRKLHSIQTR